MRQPIAAFVLSSLLLGGCATYPAESTRQSVERAAKLYEESWQAGHPWRESKRRLAVAEAALAAGDHVAAQAEAEVAAALARAALDQAAAEANASKTRFPFAQ
jgi:hypothetical protein